MKINKIIIPVVASAMLLTGCDDQIMKWGDDKAPVTSAEIPLAVKEVIANYDNIKDYAQQYTPNMLIGIGMGADMYCANENGEGDLANANYQLFTPGNAMKGDALMQNNGTLDFSTVDKLIDALDGKMKLYGHNFFWHTQQNQNYLASLIAPKMKVSSDGGKIENIVTNSGFEDGTASGYQGFWCDYTYEVVSPGHNSDKCLHITTGNPKNMYNAQLFWGVNGLEEGVTYAYSFYVKSDCNLELQVIGSQSESPYDGFYKDKFKAGSDWTLCEGEFTYDGTPESIGRVGIQFGGVKGANLWFDDFQFGKKKEDPMTNIVTNSSFEDGDVKGYQGFWCDYTYEVVSPGQDGDKCLHITTGDPKNMYNAQLFWGVNGLEAGKIYAYSFYVKSDCNLELQVIGSQSESPYDGFYKDKFKAGSDWTLCEGEFTYDGTPGNIGRVGIQFGGVKGANLWFDNFKFGLKKDQTPAKARTRSTRATTITWELKTPAQKQEALERAMDAWVKGVGEHLAAKNVVPFGYDVINEPIADGSNKFRGLDEGTFGGTWNDDNGVTHYDAAPVETEADGLNLNWGKNHWYWGYYVPDYHVKAFQLARKYLPADTKLFVNDYNLETSPKKLEALIKFAKEIDEKNGSPIVDGIGTQMHVTLNCSDDAEKNATSIAELKTKVDAMFQTMAATGKLVRVTELDLSLGTGTPSSNQYKAQSDAYRMIMESYKANVPEAQQSGITIWSLSDNEAEHEYWLKGQVPNLFDKDYKRKWAYKGFCDGIAGEDLGLKYGGEEYKAYYEKNNVSSTVDK